MRVVVVALGQDRPAARRPDRARGPRGRRLRRRRARRRARQRGAARRSPARPASRTRSRRSSATGGCARTTDTDRRGRRRRRPRRSRCRRCVVDAGRAARTGGRSTRRWPTSAPAAAAPGTDGRARRDDAAGRHDAHAHRAGARGRQRTASPSTTSSSSSAPSASTAGASSATSPPTRSSSAALRRRARRAASSCTARSSSRPPRSWPMGSAEAAELTKLAETTYRDVNIALANEFARYADRAGVDVDARDRRGQHASRSATSTGRASRSAGTASPSIRASSSPATPEARLPALAREVNGAMPALRGRAARGARCARRLSGARVAHPRRRLPRRRQGDGVLAARSPLRDALAARGARAARRRPALRRRASCAALGFEPWDGGAMRRRDPAGRPRRVPRARARRPRRACARSSTGAACSTRRASPPPAWRCGGSAGPEPLQARPQRARHDPATRSPARPSP